MTLIRARCKLRASMSPNSTPVHGESAADDLLDVEESLAGMARLRVIDDNASSSKTEETTGEVQPDNPSPSKLSKSHLCTKCGSDAKQRCVECKKNGVATWYCGKACQTLDWKSGHKKVCGAKHPMQVLPWRDPRAADGFDSSRVDFKLAFLQNLVGPFARFNGALAVVNPKAYETVLSSANAGGSYAARAATADLCMASKFNQSLSDKDDSPWKVEVFDERNAADTQACLALSREHFRLMLNEEEVPDFTAWVAATLNDTALCHHQRTARLRFTLNFGVFSQSAPELVRQLAQLVVSLVQTETAPETDLSTSCAMHALLTSLSANDFNHKNQHFMQRLLGCGGLDSTILFMHKLDTQTGLSAAVFSKRCAEMKCGVPGSKVDSFDVSTLVGSCLARLNKGGLDYETTPPHISRTWNDARVSVPLASLLGIVGTMTLRTSTDFNTFCTGIDGHKALASPGVNAALRDILTSRRPLFWELHEVCQDGKFLRAVQNLLVLLMVIDNVRKLSEAQGVHRPDLAELTALVLKSEHSFVARVELRLDMTKVSTNDDGSTKFVID